MTLKKHRKNTWDEKKNKKETDNYCKNSQKKRNGSEHIPLNNYFKYK